MSFRDPKSRRSDTRDPALDLLSDARQEVSLNAAAKRRIWDAIERGPSESRRLFWFVIPSTTVLAVVLVIALTRHHAQRTSTIAQVSTFTVPNCGVSRISEEVGAYRAVFVGPAEAAISHGGGPVTVKAGRVVLTATDEPVNVVAGTATITVEKRSLVEIVVRDYKAVYVAAYMGAATIASPTIVRLSARQAFTGGTVSTTSDESAESAWQLANGTAAAKDACTQQEEAVGHSQSEPTAAESRRPAPATTVAQPRKRVDAEPKRPAIVETPIPSPASLDKTPEHELAPVIETTTPQPAVPPSEASRLTEAIRQLRERHDARAAIAVLDDLQRTSPNGEFGREEALIRLEALQALGDSHASLEVLDKLSLPDVPRGDDLLLLRANLRAQSNRCREAVEDYGTLISRAMRLESALMGRAACYSRLGEDSSARSDLQNYLTRFPSGAHASEARHALGKQQ